MAHEKDLRKLKDLYNDTNNQPRALFINSLLHFREVMCSKEYTLEQKNRAFEDLATDYFRCKLEPEDIIHFQAISKEWEMRSLYEPFSPSVDGAYNSR